MKARHLSEQNKPVILSGGRAATAAEGPAFALQRPSHLSSFNVVTIRFMHEGNYFTYIVASRSRTLYIGITRDLEKRVFDHKRKLHEGFTATYNCTRLVWFEGFADPRGAIAREKQLKGWTRAKKIALIVRTNPAWIDLSETWYTAEQLSWTPR